MSYIKIFVNEFFHIHKKGFILITLLNIISGVILNSGLEFNILVYPLVVILVALKNFSFIRQAAIMPSVSSDFDRFSWKYFMGLPLNKKEIIQSLIIVNTITLFPLVIGLVCFLPQVLFVFELKVADLTFMLGIKIILGGIAFFMLTSIMSMKSIITFPRRQYSRVPPKVLFLQTIKLFLLSFVSVAYGLGGLAFISIILTEKLKLDLFQLLSRTINSWVVIPVSFLIVFLAFKNLLSTWQNEKAGYTKNSWDLKRDTSVCFACVFALILPTMIFENDMPSSYGDGALHSAVYHKDYDQIARILKNKENINQRSDKGFTPILIAVKEGDEKMVKFLEERGANIYERITIGKLKGVNALHLATFSGNVPLARYLLDKGFSPNERITGSETSPLHIAASICKTEVVDLLIERKVDVNILDKNKRTALHTAASRKCFHTLTSLIDAGINPNLLDKDQKTALDLVRKDDKEIAYYLEKKSRAPASQN